MSTVKQLNRHSIDAQKEAISRYCNAHGYDLVHVYSDEGVSAYKERPEHKKMMEQVLNDEGVKGVVVSDLTRFGRNTEDLLHQIKSIDNIGKKFISINDNIDISTKTGRLLLGMLSLIADYERATILERMEMGKSYAKIHGTKSGKPMHRPSKKIDWNRVKELRDLGMSWTKIAPNVGTTAPTLLKHARKKGIIGY
ncbi:MAG: recombinase family protein [Candidatus Thermoplasmatota archaeon]|nr:recombinase family protein [Candidatus Thermoplasmatota archaeon]